MIAHLYLLWIIPIQRRSTCMPCYEPNETLAPHGSAWREQLQYRVSFFEYRRWVRAFISLGIFYLSIEPADNCHCV